MWIYLILCLGLAKSSFAYLAIIHVSVARFTVLNRDMIAEGRRCDDKHVDGSWNPCDFVFYIDDCRKDALSPNFVCVNKINRFYAHEATEDVVFNSSTPSPVTALDISGEFPNQLFVNITVWDQDDGYSGDDYVGNYKLFFYPGSVSRTDTTTREHVITIPQHSQLTIRYDAYCLDDDCRTRTVPIDLQSQGQGSQQFQSQAIRQQPSPWVMPANSNNNNVPQIITGNLPQQQNNNFLPQNSFTNNLNNPNQLPLTNSIDYWTWSQQNRANQQQQQLLNGGGQGFNQIQWESG